MGHLPDLSNRIFIMVLCVCNDCRSGNPKRLLVSSPLGMYDGIFYLTRLILLLAGTRGTTIRIDVHNNSVVPPGFGIHGMLRRDFLFLCCGTRRDHRCTVVVHHRAQDSRGY